MKYVITEMLKIFAPCIIIIAVFLTGLIGTFIYRKKSVKAEKFRKALSVSSKLIIGFGGGFLMLCVILAVIIFFGYGFPAQQ